MSFEILMHTPVLLEEAIDALNLKKDKKYIDATFGQGGHSQEILARGGRVLAIEADGRQVASLKTKVRSQKNLRLVHGNFADIERIAKENGFREVEGILFDLGLSMEQIKRSGRGFSYERPAEPLDMRIDTRLTQTAADLINRLSADELYEIFSGNAEEINSRAIADAVFRSRRVRAVRTVGELLAIIQDLLPKLAGNREGIVRRIFQSLRIEVNDELANLKKGLAGAVKLLSAGGRLAIITFHPGEDRIVKQFARGSKQKLIGKKPITAKEGESFERSAKLRVMGAG